jgi:hypothetical protein
VAADVESDFTNEFLRYQCFSWAFRTWHQGRFLLRIHDAAMRRDKTGTLLDPLGPLFDLCPVNHYTLGSIQRAHEHYFLIALAKFFRWAETLTKKSNIEIPDHLSLFAFKEQFKDARDMWEHDEEYLTDAGRHKNRFLVTRNYLHPDYPSVRAASSWSLTIGKEYVLANRIDVYEVTKAAKETIEILHKVGFVEGFLRSDAILDPS